MKNIERERLVKEWYCQQLEKYGFVSPRIRKDPADITAVKDGKTWWFEIKYTTKKDKYYGGSYETEWEQAFKDPDHFRFVVIKTNKLATKFEVFHEYTPKEFMDICKIPPFVATFTIRFTPLKRARKVTTEEVKSIDFTKEVFEKIHDTFSIIRKKLQDN